MALNCVWKNFVRSTEATDVDRKCVMLELLKEKFFLEQRFMFCSCLKMFWSRDVECVEG